MQESCCWGALISQARCRRSNLTLPDITPFLAQFCTGCQTHGFCVPVERVLVPPADAVLLLSNSSSNGPWSAAQRGVPRFRIANDAANCVGPAVVIFESPVPQAAATTAANANAAAREGSSQGARLDAALMGGGGTVAPDAAPTAIPPRARWERLPGTWLFQPSSGLPCVRFVPMHETLVLSPTISEECAAALGLTATALPLLAPQAATTSAAQVPPVPQPAVALWNQRRPRLLELVSNLMAHGVTSHVLVTGNAGQTLLLSSLVGQLDEMIRNPLAVHGRAFPLEMLEIIQAQSNASHLCRSLLNHRHRPPSLSSPIPKPSPLLSSPLLPYAAAGRARGAVAAAVGNDAFGLAAGVAVGPLCGAAGAALLVHRHRAGCSDNSCGGGGGGGGGGGISISISGSGGNATSWR